MVTSDDEMRAAVVSADDRVPHGLARPRHAHREIDKAQHRAPLGEMLEDAFVAPHPGEAIHIPGKTLSHDGMKEQVRFARMRGLQK